jgi:hypothetical protein
MKPIAVKMIIAGLMLSTTPALAAPPQIEDFCWAQGRKSGSTGEARENTSLANCIADLTPYPPAKRRHTRNAATKHGLSHPLLDGETVPSHERERLRTGTSTKIPSANAFTRCQ